MSKNTDKKLNLSNIKWLVVGLGNPGEKYNNTRHNIGSMAVQTFRQETPGDIISDVEVLLPDTYMNLSGGPVAKALGKDKAERIKNAQSLIVVHDDIDLPFGEVKISIGRGSGGQKGVESIIKSIGTRDFIRVRIGIVPIHFGKMRKPKGGNTVARFVLKRFGLLERNKLPEILEKASNAILEITQNGVESAMNKFN